MNGTLLTALIIAVVGSPAVSAIVSALIGHHYQKKDRKIQNLEVMQDAIKALSHDSYFRHCRYLLGKHEITEDELENHTYLYDAYHAQGLNGIGDTMHEQIRKMKVKPERVEWDTRTKE